MADEHKEPEKVGYANDPFMADRATNEALRKQFKRQEERLAALEKSLASEHDVLFNNLMSQQQQLFAAGMRDFNGHITIGLKSLDTSGVEISEQAIASKTVADLSPVITKAVDAAVAGNVGNASVANSAVAAAIAAAVVAALKDQGVGA
jgi:hypothetical protein